MRIINLEDYQITSGGFADILIDVKSGKALKLFKSYDHPSLDGTGKEEVGAELTNQYRRNVFITELEAYKLVQKSKVLKNHTPIFFGQEKFDVVIRGKENVTHRYIKNCCFEMEHVPGPCIKLMELRNDDPLIQDLEQSLKFDLETILSEFDNVGILYILDSSVIYNPRSFVVIDFATMDPHEFESIIGKA